MDSHRILNSREKDEIVETFERASNSLNNSKIMFYEDNISLKESPVHRSKQTSSGKQISSLKSELKNQNEMM